MGRPAFRVGAYRTYLLPLAQRLRLEHPTIEIVALANDYVAEALAGAADLPKDLRDCVRRVPLIDEEGRVLVDDRLQEDLYLNRASEPASRALARAVERAMDGRAPDLVIAWETPTTLLRAMYPEALVLDLMPGAFMRPPYPKTIAIDPKGLYRHSILRDLVSGDLAATEAELAVYREARSELSDFFAHINARDVILSQVDGAFERYRLIPFQINEYFGFSSNASHRNQFDWLLAELAASDPKEGVIATQYVGGLIEEKVVNSGNFDFLKKNFPNFLHAPAFDKVDNISQYIAPWVDTLATVSSTLGLQALFYGADVSCRADSHLTPLSDLRSPEAKENASALLMGRYYFLWRRLTSEPGYFAALLSKLKAFEKQTPTAVYRAWSDTTPAAEFLGLCTFRRAAEILEKLSEARNPVADPQLAAVRAKIDRVETVSFDVFDTLITRPVFEPSDVFLLCGQTLNERLDAPIDGLDQAYALLRLQAERSLRRERDAALRAGAALPEEIQAADVLAKTAQLSGLEDRLSPEALLTLEQEIELALLEPKALGRALYDYAKAAGKKIVIISDFIHDEDFVRRCLTKCGYADFDHLFVSSAAGDKKHSGALFRTVCAALELAPDQILHIGDNPVGDVERAADAGLATHRTPVARKDFRALIERRSQRAAQTMGSLAYRTAYTMYANRYWPLRTLRAPLGSKHELARSPEELGYLTLGPLAVAFAEWVRETAIEQGCSQVVFFARDCVLPYRAAVIAADAAGGAPLRNRYLPVSRAATQGIDLLSPDQVFRTPLRDVSGAAKVGAVVRKRFGVDPDKIAPEAWRRFGFSGPEAEIKTAAPAALYGLVHQHLRACWDDAAPEFADKRDAYRSLMAERDIALDQKTALVDIGYSGTISKSIAGLFSADTAPLFMMMYADAFGAAPIAGGRAFFGEAIRKLDSDGNVFLKHNLLIETLLNEPMGSLVAVDPRGGDDAPILQREQVFSTAHFDIVERAHRGATQFARDWRGKLGALGRRIRFEPNLCLEMLGAILNDPTFVEASLLEGLVFDNGFAMHDQRHVLAPRAAGPDAPSIWREGHAAFHEPDRPHETRMRLRRHGAELTLAHEKPQKRSWGVILFGAAPPEILTLGGVEYDFCWICDGVTAVRPTFEPAGDAVEESLEGRILFHAEEHVDLKAFRIHQRDRPLAHRIEPVSATVKALRFRFDPLASLVIDNPSHRFPHGSAKVQRKLYWKLLDFQIGR